MQLGNIVGLLVTLSGISLAMPTAVESGMPYLDNSTHSTSKYEPLVPDPPESGLYICEKPHWAGFCIQGVPPSVRGLGPDGKRICHNLAFADSQFVSFGPDKDIICTVFTGTKCDGDGMTWAYPGWDYLPGPFFAHGKGGYRTFTCWRKP